ncbi:hypothetical protein J1605_021600 [Eschrichtius robustus]|uniref:Uncharacterized protein n=1 Tax=Eschrichtius robustus TaxID=9764 RepID=A0AB34HAS1_ESCRO|nr:hypothetical protein J1605_021600 [Eschrichtius robustus]
MGKLRPGEQKQQAGGHAAPWWQKQELSPEPAGHAHLGPDSDTPHGLHLMFTVSFLIRLGAGAAAATALFPSVDNEPEGNDCSGFG